MSIKFFADGPGMFIVSRGTLPGLQSCEMSELYVILGFGLAAYSIVANDAIQTLGTFLSSNSKRPWWVLWIFAASILSAVLIFGWWRHDGDVSYGRLSGIAHPEPLTFLYVVPPLVLLVLTRAGIPVSTTFLVLTIFSPKHLPAMLMKSVLGYAIAFSVGIVVYRFVAIRMEEWFIRTAEDKRHPWWTGLQWCSTGFLWSQWLIQDLANIFVYFPRKVELSWLIPALIGMTALLAYIFYSSGGAIQKIVTSKTNTTDIRSATIIDFIYGCILLVFKEMNNVPMSTTWVFLGLLAGREFAITTGLNPTNLKLTLRMVSFDVFKAFIGLMVSVLLAYGLPMALGSQAAP